MTLSFSFLMTEALLLFSPDCSPLQHFSHKVKGRYHWILQSLSASCAVLGLVVIFYNKQLNNKSHFVTWHGLVGLLTVLYAVLQSLGGVSLLYPKLVKRWSLSKLKRYHATSGLLAYLLGCTSLLLGMCSLWFTTAVHSLGWYLASSCPALTGLVLMNQVTNAYVARKRF
ncbi:C56D2 protein, partial [Amia calva]|nr:C56D2 protein [Amia calva]